MLNGADWAILAVLAISSLISIKRGFVKEALSLAIWLIALMVASTFSPKLSPLFAEHISAYSLRHMAAFASLFVATLVVGGGVNFLLSTLIKATGLSGTDRLLGVLFGLIRGTVIVMIALIYGPKLLPVNQDAWWLQSVLIPEFLAFESKFRALAASVYAFVQQFFISAPSTV